MIFKTFQEASDYLGYKTDRPAPKTMGSPRSTRIVRLSEDRIGLRYHNTEVVVYTSVGMELYTGGWYTVTTKARINDALPNNVTLWQEKGVWYLSIRTDSTPSGWAAGQQYVFEEGATVSYDGKLLSILPEFTDDVVKQQQKKVRAINKYVNAFMDALEAGEVEQPSNGDCWACVSMYTSNNGESVFGNDHLDLHIEENYFVPSLVYAALKHGSSSMSMKWWVQAMVNGTTNHIGNERKHVGSLLKRYMKQRMGVGS